MLSIVSIRRRWRRAPRVQRSLAIVLATVAVVVLALGVHTVGRFQGWFIEPLAPRELSALLRPHYSIAKPAGNGPFPAALLYHGCDGPKDNMQRWSERLVESGWAAIVVDSHTPRGYLDLARWRLVCTGQLLPGPERAGDVLVSLTDAAKMPFVDADRIALIGMSHGGWSIMELLSLDPPEEVPVSLARSPGAPRRDPLESVDAVVLVYPWCGLANRARHEGWDHPAPALFMLVETDMVAPSFECELLAQTLAEQGRDVEVVVYEGVTHGFDQSSRSDFSLLRFDPETTEDAIDRTIRFLERGALKEER